MDNPFFYGKTVSGGFFTDREKEIKELKEDIKNGQNVIIWSPRRYGKTSLIKKVLLELKGEGLITIYIDLFMVTSMDKFIDIYARAVARGIEGGVEKIIKAVKKLLPRILPKIIIRHDQTADFEFSYDVRADTGPILEDLFEAVSNYAAKKRKKAVVCFDEFQEINNFQEKDEIEKSMRSLFQFHKNVAYVFLGSKYHLMQKMFQDRSRPFYNSGRVFSLRRISREVFCRWIEKRFKQTNVGISKDIIDKIMDITKCHPYHTQQLCYVIWKIAHDSGIVVKSHIQEAISEILAEQGANFTNLWDSLSAKQRNFLVAFALSRPVNLYGKDFILKNNLGTSSSLQKIIKALVNKQVIEKDNGDVVFNDIFFPEWIKEKTIL
ncbi:MAG: hypothetical protein B1H08_04785 [Candidatus Omnitrophica bacterium 4484_171]|nr:MAG: hypothetical protein B1H08_04785 [Candidatus Omnitrophica bacterium 4484_171]